MAATVDRGPLGIGASFSNSLLAWYARHRRDLPWRVARGLPDPYHVLLSELMLQQTQVSTVIPYFRRFLERFPTVRDLAAADEQEVLRLWQGLGYYSRARNLRKAASAIVERHAGVVPRNVDELLALPGIGRYTAGAIASLAYNQPAPILDGNVQRVLCRVHAIRRDPREPAINKQLWSMTEASLPPGHAADFNSAMMELGATVCTPRNPLCDECPVRSLCRASAQGLQHTIPPSKRAAPKAVERRDVFCIERDGQWLIEQRPASGRWASMWQFITVNAGEECGIPTAKRHRLARITHTLTHREYVFTAWRCRASRPHAPAENQRWVALSEMADYPLSKPQAQILALL